MQVPISQIRLQVQGTSIVFIFIPVPACTLAFSKSLVHWKVKYSMKIETATVGRNKSITDPGQLIDTLGDVNWAHFSQGKKSRPTSQTLCWPFKAQPGKTTGVNPDFGKWERRSRDALLPSQQLWSMQCGMPIQPLGPQLLSLFFEIKRCDLWLRFWMRCLRQLFPGKSFRAEKDFLSHYCIRNLWWSCKL